MAGVCSPVTVAGGLVYSWALANQNALIHKYCQHTTTQHSQTRPLVMSLSSVLIFLDFLVSLECLTPISLYSQPVWTDWCVYVASSASGALRFRNDTLVIISFTHPWWCFPLGLFSGNTSVGCGGPFGLDADSSAPVSIVATR